MWTNIVGAALWIAHEYESEQREGLIKPTKKDRGLDYPVAQPPSTSNEQTPLLSGSSQDAEYNA